MKDIKVIINNHEVGNLFFEKEKNPAKAGLNDMLVAGIEPATSSLPWMRSAY